MKTKCKHISTARTETDFGTIYKCNACGEDITSFIRKLQNLFIKQRFYQGQGLSYTSWVMGIYNTVQTGGILYLILGGIPGEIAIWIFLLVWLIQAAGETWIGYKDYQKWKMAQRQATLSISFNPYSVEVLERLRNVEKILCGDNYKKESCLDLFKK